MKVNTYRVALLSWQDYIGQMAKKAAWRDWGSRFREGCRAKKTSTRLVAGKLGLAESTVRSWINGSREINLADFIRLCEAAGLDPATVLFAGQLEPGFLAIGKAWSESDRRGRELLQVAAEAALRLRDAQDPPGAISRPPRS